MDQPVNYILNKKGLESFWGDLREIVIIPEGINFKAYVRDLEHKYNERKCSCYEIGQLQTKSGKPELISISADMFDAE